jgi:tripartite-type tricarboxylate transporter receptor subunit TctC
MRRRVFLPASIAASILLPPRAIRAAEDAVWPSRPIRLVVCFPSGSAGDTVGRRLAERLTTALGQTVVAENRGGTGGTLGADIVAKAPPDGYVLGLGGIAPHAIAPAVYSSLPYHPVRNFTHIALLGEFPLAIAVRAEGPLRGLADILDFARRNPGGLRVGTPGNGTAAHVGLEQLRSVAGVEAVHVPFRGPASAIVETIAGRIEAVMASVSEFAGNDRLRMVALALPERLRDWPMVPTFREGGVDLVATIWFGLCGPAGLPGHVADRLHHESRLMRAPPGNIGLGAAPDRALERSVFAAFVSTEASHWAAVARAAQLRAE